MYMGSLPEVLRRSPAVEGKMHRLVAALCVALARNNPSSPSLRPRRLLLANALTAATATTATLITPNQPAQAMIESNNPANNYYFPMAKY